MKKLLHVVVLSLAFVVLVGCGQQSLKDNASTISSSEVAKQEKVSLVLTVDGKEVASKSIEVAEGTTVLAAIQANFEVEEDNGFITSIDGHEQDQKESKFWLYTIDGEPAMKGANELALVDGNTVVFNLAKL